MALLSTLGLTSTKKRKVPNASSLQIIIISDLSLRYYNAVQLAAELHRSCGHIEGNPSPNWCEQVTLLEL